MIVDRRQFSRENKVKCMSVLVIRLTNSPTNEFEVTIVGSIYYVRATTAVAVLEM